MESIPANDRGDARPESESYGENDHASYAPVAAQHDRAPGSGPQRPLRSWAGMRDMPPTPEQVRLHAPAEPHGHVAAVRHRDGDDPGASATLDVDTTEPHVAHDPPRDEELDANADAEMDVDTTLRLLQSRRQENERRMVSRLGALRSRGAHGQQRALACAEHEVGRPDAEPSRSRLHACVTRHDVDREPAGAVVSHLDRPRPWRLELEMRRRHRQRDARPVGTRPFHRSGCQEQRHAGRRNCERELQRAIAVKVSVAV